MPSDVIQWFPGHMAKTRRLMQECLSSVDLSIEILDARIPLSSRNPEIKKILGKKPVLGLGLGHQLVALALGAKTSKHKYGHRGSNQPVKCLKSGNVYISTQNHGYDVVKSSVTQGEVLFVNVNDNSCEGIVYEALNAITVQFVPEACSIGNPVNPVYSKFVAFMEKEKANA